MIEVIKHAFGLCGEHWHPNIFTIIISSSPMVTSVIWWLKSTGILGLRKSVNISRQV